MEIKKGILCRDRGLLFQKIIVESASNFEGMSLVASASTKSAAETPCEVYPLRQGEFVLCLPDFSIDQNVRVKALSDGGEVLASLVLAISGKAAKWVSRFNYLRSRAEAFEIRNIDLRFLSHKADIRISALSAGRARYVLRGLVVVPAADIECIEVMLLDSVGCPVSDKQKFFVAAKDSYGKFDTKPYTTFPFHLNVPQTCKPACIVAAVPGHSGLNSFCGIPPKAYKTLVDNATEACKAADESQEYGAWFERFRARDGELARQRNVRFPQEPTFSVIVPLYHTPSPLFKDMADSVLAQTYPYWELVLVNSTPGDEELTSLVEEYAGADDRVKVVTLDDNYGITENTNRGVAVAEGDYVCFFDHDDVLEPDILFHYASAINDDESIDMLYCDEDKLFRNKIHAGVHFKPDFSIDQLRNNNYICHMLTVRKSLLDRIGPTPEGYDGAQDHWLTLRVSEETKNIKHIPKVLYHWRATEGSTALSNENKSYATDAGVKAVQSHLDRLGIGATAEPYGRPFTCRVKYPVMEDGSVSIVIPSHNGEEVLRKCIDSILEKTVYPDFEIVIVENNSTEERLFSYYKELEGSNANVRVLTWEGEGFNFSTLVNYGVEHSTGKLILLLNNDIEVIDSDWLEVLAGFASRPEVGAVGPRLWYPDDTYQHAGLAVVGNGVARLFVGMPEEHAPTKYFAYHDMTRNVSAVTGACLMTRRDVYEEVGGFDEALSVAFNDVDYCLRVAERGYLTVYTADTSLYHYESFTRGADHDGSEKQIRMFKELATFRERWAEIYVTGDPYYNINLNQMEPAACYFGIPKV